MPTLIIKRPQHLIERYGLGRLNVTIGPSELHDICINESVQAEIYYEGGRYYLWNMGGSGTPHALAYNGENVVEPVALADKGQIRAGSTVIDFEEEGGSGEVSDASSFTGADARSADYRARQNVGVGVGRPTDKAAGLAALLENEADLGWLVPAILRRAATSYERAGQLRDAAQCLVEAGEEDRAARIFLRLEDHRQAAPLLLAQKRYGEALASYRAWARRAETEGVVARVTALLGVAACLVLSGEEPAEARRAYLRARELVKNTREEQRRARARGWKALGDYGVLVGRDDIVQLAYERALALYGEQHSEERLLLASDYLKAAEGNRLLVAQLEQRVAEWTQSSPRVGAGVGEIDIEVGARFGEWEVWRVTARLILFAHKQSGTRVEVWTNSDGWFMWGWGLYHAVVSSDGTQGYRGDSARQRLGEYFRRTAQRTLATGSSEVGNYRMLCSPESLALTNVVGGVVITIYPNSSHFEFNDNQGRTRFLGHGVTEVGGAPTRWGGSRQ